MNIQIFGKSKSFDTKKAERWFKERRIKYQYIDLVSKGVSPGKYRSIRAAVGSFDALVDKDCRAYEALYMAYITPQAAEEKLLEYPELFAAPIVRNGKQATVGYCPEIWQTWNRNKGLHRAPQAHGFFGQHRGFHCAVLPLVRVARAPP